MAYRDVILADTPVAYWRLGEPSGTTATDEMGALDGTYRDVGGGSGPTLGQASLLSNDADTAALWADAGDEVQLLHDAILNPTNAITIEMWINANTWSGNQRIFQKGLENQYRFHHEGATTNLVFVLDGETSVLFPQPSTGVRHHVVVTYNRSYALGYVDGRLAGSSILASGPIATTTSDAAIGNRPGANSAGDQFDGVIDEVAFYNIALSATQVGVHYSVGVGGGMVRADMSRFPKSMLQRVA